MPEKLSILRAYVLAPQADKKAHKLLQVNAPC
jgi:hypothetical protein